MASIIPKYVMFFVVTLTCNGDNTLRMYSPNKEYEFCINRTLDESSGSVLSEFSICDKDHKVLQNLDKTEFPVIGAKWHKSSNAIIIVEHISRQVVIMLVNRQKDRWKISEVSQFKNPPGYFQLVEAISTDIAFRCYYLGHDMGSGDWDALCTDIDIMSGEAALKSSDKGFVTVTSGLEKEEMIAA